MPVEVERAIEGLKEEGRLEGELKVFVSMLRQGLISEEVALKNLNISKEELENKIKEYTI